ncbi:MAG: AtpZ/AtpI family protein [Melioribacteraceae bacterium]|nr:AtpZ/AtpI family protein [Melioribacteraceae bacterium]MCF8356703.1 AtpZ/AtpI family protein [Melioribacteraceae bacterium]MCF8393859.1 AtpZ/AtpI family protein [Melioribacteraceae bacterium]MCF8418232.1 AtpZ/AtpI family protein [Melioribacteraceae bacterium]
MNKNDDSGKYVRIYKDVGPYLGLGTQLAATIVLMFFLGRWLDSEFDTEPLFILVFSFLGGFAGIYNFIKAVLDINKKNREKNN